MISDVSEAGSGIVSPSQLCGPRPMPVWEAYVFDLYIFLFKGQPLV